MDCYAGRLLAPAEVFARDFFAHWAKKSRKSRKKLDGVGLVDNGPSINKKKLHVTRDM